jgi:hypothetical protein
VEDRQDPASATDQILQMCRFNPGFVLMIVRSIALVGNRRSEECSMLRSSSKLRIHRRRGGEIDALIGEVAFDRRGIALGRRAIATGAGRDDFDRLAGT